ncbi:MAG: hypothetical protein AVDCRST_MAG01-01-68, partial [uncultured Rubrobacteraceae bacterium]
ARRALRRGAARAASGGPRRRRCGPRRSGYAVRSKVFLSWSWARRPGRFGRPSGGCTLRYPARRHLIHRSAWKINSRKFAV